ncbi:LamG domain-containing protein [Paenibacillus sp. 481]|uniref:LamG domain-containing protein n=1 Tax=Paenibacillus sp. 481 TaxID=2835869 RepID=UPI001E2E2FC0|nr:LamG domain-containing protein [Paenibacillus sp. 481]UHA74527.1 LamG domain-containing protein [Paenibacillus sp. 481]
MVLFLSMLFTSTAAASSQMIYEYDVNGNLLNQKNVKLSDIGTTLVNKKTFSGHEKLHIHAKNLNAAENGRTTVQFWMYWTGQDNMMPFSWHSGYTLWIKGNVLGFNSGVADIYGFNAQQLINKWVRITAIFNNGDITKSELYVNGERQPLQHYGNTLSHLKYVSDNATISGWSINEDYKFKGQLADLKIWNRALTQSEIISSAESIQPVANNHVVGHWRLNDAPNHSFKLTGTQRLELNGLNVNTAAGAKSTVQFWMKWNGKDSEMPFSWGHMYTLYIQGNRLGFNTGVGDMYGVQSGDLSNRWVHVTAIFTNGDPYLNELYLNGVKQTLSKNGGAQQRNVTNKAFISGWGHDDHYKFNGEMADLKIWNRALNEIEIQSEMYKTTLNAAKDLVYSSFE